MSEMTMVEVMAELATLEDPKMRTANEKRGNDHGVNLSRVRAFAKRLKIQQDLARELWATDDTAARLLALLICRPRDFGRDELDTMLRQARAPKVHDWLVNYVVKKSPYAEELHLTVRPDLNHRDGAPPERRLTLQQRGEVCRPTPRNRSGSGSRQYALARGRSVTASTP